MSNISTSKLPMTKVEGSLFGIYTNFTMNIIAYGSTPYVGMALKKMAATLKVHK